MDLHVYIVDAFATCRFGGTPIGVVADAEGLKEEEYQIIANELRASLTAFAEPVDQDVFRTRYFTSKTELEGSGQGSLALFYVLTSLGYIKAIENGVKLVYEVNRNSKKKVYIYYKDYKIENLEIEVSRPEILNTSPDISNMLSSMSLSTADIGIDGAKDARAMVVKAEENTLIVPIRTRQALYGYTLDEFKFRDAAKSIGVENVHLFYQAEDGFYYVRNYTKDLAFEEDSSSAYANAALHYYLIKNKLTAKLKAKMLQGETMNRPSRVQTRYLEDKDSAFITVMGMARISLDGILNI